MISFSAKIFKIGINPYVLPPAGVLKYIYKQAGKNKGPIPVCGKINGKKFTQTLVKYRGKWRLYVNMPMRRSAGIDVGDIGDIQVGYNSTERTTPMHPKLKSALEKNNRAFGEFNKLTPSRQKEILKYINSLKTKDSIDRNISKVTRFLSVSKKSVNKSGKVSRINTSKKNPFIPVTFSNNRSLY
jgi:hypothetical protein